MANKNSGVSRFLRFGGSSSSDAEGQTTAIKFKFQALVAATKNFAPEFLIGEGEYGRTYKGCLNRSGQVVAVKQVCSERISRAYCYRDLSVYSTTHMRSLLYHPNIDEIIGYCIEGDQIYFVSNFMPLGSLRDYLQDLSPNKKPLDWNTRIQIAVGAAKGIKYLHDESTPVIHGNITPSNILLCEGYHPRLSDFFGFKERIPEPDESCHIIRGRHFYRHAPEVFQSLKLTQQSDIFSFGFVLLELISGQMARGKPSLIEWAKRKLVSREEFTTLADPLLKGHYPEQGLYHVLFLAAECLQTKAVSRPRIGYVVNVLSNLASEIYNPNAIQINRVGRLTIGNIQKESLTDQWRDVYCFYF